MSSSSSSQLSIGGLDAMSQRSDSAVKTDPKQVSFSRDERLKRVAIKEFDFKAERGIKALDVKQQISKHLG